MVVDASVVASALLSHRSGEWARRIIEADDLKSPHVMPAEVTNALRRAELGGVIPGEIATGAQAELQLLPLELFPFRPTASRVWELRRNITPYDAWYVALAESLDAPLATLDRRLAAAVGPRCSFLLPPA